MDGKWTDDEKKEIAKAFALLATVQKTYGRELDPSTALPAWEWVLARDFTGKQVTDALQLYMRQTSDMPTPADLIKLMVPPTTRISQPEFIHAKDQWAKEGYPQFSYHHMIVKQYEKENADERAAPAPIEDPKILKIIQSSIKRMN